MVGGAKIKLLEHVIFQYPIALEVKSIAFDDNWIKNLQGTAGDRWIYVLEHKYTMI